MTSPNQQEATIEELRRDVAELQNLVYAWKNAGAGHLFAGHGYHQVGRRFRFSSDGLQIATGSSAVVSFAWLPDYEVNFDANADFPHARLSGLVNDNAAQDAQVFLYTRASSTDGTSITSDSNLTESLIALQSLSGARTADLQVYANEDTGEEYVAVLGGTPFWIIGGTSDPAARASDGMLYYRTDTDKLRLRANGATVNLVTDGDTNWTDLTDGGATTLHTHAASGWSPTVTTQTGTYTAADTDFVICNSASAFTVTLPAATANVRIVVKNINTGAVTVDGAGSDTIDGVASIILGTYEAVSLIADGTSWHIF